MRGRDVFVFVEVVFPACDDPDPLLSLTSASTGGASVFSLAAVMFAVEGGSDVTVWSELDALLTTEPRLLGLRATGRTNPVFCRTPILKPFADDDVTLRVGLADVVTILGIGRVTSSFAEV